VTSSTSLGRADTTLWESTKSKPRGMTCAAIFVKTFPTIVTSLGGPEDTGSVKPYATSSPEWTESHIENKYVRPTVAL